VLGILGPKTDAVLDALEPGGSDDPCEGLDPAERLALETLFESGFPRPRALPVHATVGGKRCTTPGRVLRAARERPVVRRRLLERARATPVTTARSRLGAIDAKATVSR